jgi:hypothetical protein
MKGLGEQIAPSLESVLRSMGGEASARELSNAFGLEPEKIHSGILFLKIRGRIHSCGTDGKRLWKAWND